MNWQRRRRAPRMRHVMAACAAALLFGCVAALSLNGRLPTSSGEFAALIDEFGVALGADISHVAVTGHQNTPLDEIYDAIGIADRVTFAAFDVGAARERLGKLPWVETSRIIFILPDTLAVEITERKPTLVWQHRNMLFLLDGKGRVLEPVSPKAYPGLPLVVGEGAPEAAPQLFAALKKHPDLKARVSAYRRIGNRRWTLDLEGGLRVDLPGDDMLLAIRRAARLVGMEGLARRYSAVDLRIPGEVVLRSKEKFAAAMAREQRVASKVSRTGERAGRTKNAAFRPITRLRRTAALGAFHRQEIRPRPRR